MPEKIAEFFVIELWTDVKGTIGWKLVSHSDKDAIDVPELQQMLLELTEWSLDPKEKDPVVYTMIMQEKGGCTTRQKKTHLFSSCEIFVNMRANMRRSHWLILDRQIEDSKFLRVWWSLLWVYHWLAGHFDAHQKLRARPATQVPATPAEVVSEQSEASSAAIPGSGGTVVPFRKRDTRDSRPL